MKGLFISIGFLTAFCFPIMAPGQKSFVSTGAEVGIPNSYGLNMIAGTLMGGSFRVESSFGKHTAGLASIGYLFSPEQHPYPSAPATTSNYKIIPFQIGMKYYLKEKGAARKGLFFSGELGLLFTSTHFTYESNPDNKRNYTDLGISPGVGYLFDKFEPSFRLQYDLSDSGFNIYYYNFRLAYVLRKRSKKK